MAFKLVSWLSKLCGVRPILWKGLLLLPVRYRSGEDGMVIPLPAVNNKFHELVVTRGEDGNYVIREVNRGLFVGEEEEELKRVVLRVLKPVYIIKNGVYGLTFMKDVKVFECKPYNFQKVLKKGVRYCFNNPIGVRSLSLDFEDGKMYYDSEVRGFIKNYLEVLIEQLVVSKGKVVIKYIERKDKDIAFMLNHLLEGKENGKSVKVEYNVSNVSVYSTYEKTYFKFS